MGLSAGKRILTKGLAILIQGIQTDGIAIAYTCANQNLNQNLKIKDGRKPSF